MISPYEMTDQLIQFNLAVIILVLVLSKLSSVLDSTLEETLDQKPVQDLLKS